MNAAGLLAQLALTALYLLATAAACCFAYRARYRRAQRKAARDLERFNTNAARYFGWPTPNNTNTHPREGENE